MELLEIEFTYKNKEYFISNFQEGRSLILDSEKLCDYTHDNYKFVQMANTDGMTIEALFKIMVMKSNSGLSNRITFLNPSLGMLN